MARKLTIEEVQAICDGKGLEFLSASLGKRSTVTVQCTGHEWTARVYDVKNGKLCPICPRERKPNPRQYTLEFVRQKLKEAGLTLRSTQYKNVHQKLDFTCSKGHEHSISFEQFLDSPRCALCVYDSLRLPIEQVRAEFAQRRWTLKSTTYINSDEKLEFLCENNHTAWISLSDLRRGRNCIECTGRVNVTLDLILEELRKIEWKLTSGQYTNPHEKLEMECNNGHPLKISWSDFFHEGVRCKYCQGKDPVSERSIEEQRSIKLARVLQSRLSTVLSKRGRMNGFKYDFCSELAQGIIARIGEKPSKDFHCDHAVPLSWFNHTKRDQVSLCWEARNFQWLIGKENIVKNNRLTEAQMLALSPYQVCIANMAEFRPIDQEKLMKRLDLWMPPECAAERLRSLDIAA